MLQVGVSFRSLPVLKHRGAAPVAYPEYGHLSAGALAAATTIRQEFSKCWAGAPDFATDAEYTAAGGTVQLCTSVANFESSLSGIDTTKHHKRILQTTGIWTTASGGTDMHILGKDFLAGGGSLLIISQDPANPVKITNWMRVTGSTGIHFKNVAFCHSVTNAGKDPTWTPSKAADPANPLYNTADPRNTNNMVYVTRNSTNPAYPVVIFENCRFGVLHANASAPPTEFTVGLRLEYCHEVQVKGCSFKGCYNGISTVRTRRVLSHRNDLQQIISDNEVNLCNYVAADSTPPGITVDDPHVYYWARLNTYRNPVDANNYLNPDGSDPEFWNTHSDVFQLGTTTDSYGYRALMEYCTAHRSRVTYHDYNDAVAGMVRKDGGIQGAYMDDTPKSINLVLHSNLLTGTGYNVMTAWSGTVYAERNTLGRASKLAPSAVLATDGYNFTIDYHPRFWSRKDDLAGAYAEHNITDNIFAELSTTASTGMAVADVVNQAGNVIADPRLGSAAGVRYSDVLTGPFTTDGEGRTTYSFTDDGAATQAAFRTALYSIFKPKTATVGVSNPTSWPTE